jgi:hypothetical protein
MNGWQGVKDDNARNDGKQGEEEKRSHLATALVHAGHVDPCHKPHTWWLCRIFVVANDHKAENIVLKRSLFNAQVSLRTSNSK